MITQYSENYNSISNDIQNIVANSIGLMDEYILMQTGENEWTALYKTMGSNETKMIRISKESKVNTFSVSRDTYSGEFGAIISNEFYTYSNIGYGKSLDLPVNEGVTSWSMIIITCILMFAILFKGVLFKCLRRKRR